MIKLIIHIGNRRISVNIELDNKQIALIKQIPNRKWSQTKKIWHLPDNTESRNYLKNIFSDIYIDFEQDKNSLEKENNNMVFIPFIFEYSE